MGWLDFAKLDKVIDGNMALMEIFPVDPRTGKHDLDTAGPAPGAALIVKIPTAGLADDTYVHVKNPQYFQITSTQKFNDTTYFVAEPIGQGPKHH